MFVSIVVGFFIYIMTGSAAAAWIVGLILLGLIHPASRRLD